MSYYDGLTSFDKLMNSIVYKTLIHNLVIDDPRTGKFKIGDIEFQFFRDDKNKDVLILKAVLNG